MIPMNIDKINYIIAIAREYSEGSPAMISEELSEIHDSDRYTENNLEETITINHAEDHACDSAYQDLKSAIETLNEEERNTLVALVWLGRGTYNSDEWDAALEDARAASNDHTSNYLMRSPLMADYLEEGLIQMDVDE